MIKTANLILASASPRRQELIRILGLPVHIIPSHADETVTPDLTPEQVVEQLALRKARSVEQELDGSQEGAIIVGSDTVVVLDQKVLGKPQDPEHAHAMLRSLQGRTHQVFSGVACIEPASGMQVVRHAKTNVHMKPLGDKQIDRYIATGEPMDKAGAYAIQGLGATFVEGIEGDYFNVVGLPLSLLSDMLSEFGVSVL